MEVSPPINTFRRNTIASPMSVKQLCNEHRADIDNLRMMILGIRESNHTLLQRSRERSPKSLSTGKLPSVTEGDCGLVDRTKLSPCKKLSLRWRGPRRILKTIYDYLYLVENLRTGEPSEVHTSTLKLYRGPELDSKAIMSHVLQSKTDITNGRVINLVEEPDGLKMLARWKGLSNP